MKTIIKKYCSFIFLTALSLLISACGSGGSTGNQNGEGTGSVAVLLTDAPIDNFNKFMLTVSEISLLGDDGSVSVNLFSGNETIDLLDLNSHSDLFSLATNIPAGNYEKIRMQVSNPQLIRLDMDGNIIETVVPKMGGNGKLDLNPQGDINVVSGETIALQVDLDVEKSIQLKENGNGDYRFRPVVFVDILTNDLKGKLVRISGYVNDIEEGGFDLCQDEVINNDDDDDSQSMENHCVKIFTESSTSYFDELGKVVHTPELDENDVITILGYYSDMNDRYVGFNAEIIELAAADVFQTYHGVINNIDLDNHLIELNNEFNVLKTILYYPETKVFDMSGNAMSLDDLSLDMNIKIEGIYDDTNEQVNAAVIFVEPASQQIPRLAGDLISLNDDLTGFDMADNTQGDVCVDVNENTNIYSLMFDDDGFKSEIIDFSELQTGQYLETYGSFNLLGCFVAESVLLEKL